MPKRVDATVKINHMLARIHAYRRANPYPQTHLEYTFDQKLKEYLQKLEAASQRKPGLRRAFLRQWYVTCVHLTAKWYIALYVPQVNP